MHSKTKPKVSYFQRSIENCSWCQQWDLLLQEKIFHPLCVQSLCWNRIQNGCSCHGVRSFCCSMRQQLDYKFLVYYQPLALVRVHCWAEFHWTGPYRYHRWCPVPQATNPPRRLLWQCWLEIGRIGGTRWQRYPIHEDRKLFIKKSWVFLRKMSLQFEMKAYKNSKSVAEIAASLPADGWHFLTLLKKEDLS